VDDAALTRILNNTPGESPDQANTRKERELGTAFARMSMVECRGMAMRMQRLREGDAVSEGFDRLPKQLKDRLLEFLTDERRLKSLKR
jgi:hypothetical protein